MDFPMHTQLYNSLKDWFTGGFGLPDQLPTEQDIMRRFAVGRGTVRVALNELVRDGIIIRTPGKGSFLAPDYRVRLKRYSVAILLSEREFSGSDSWEYSWHNHMEMLNGVMKEALMMNLSLEIIPESAIGPELNEGYDAFISFRYIREEKLSLLHRPVIPFHYELDMAGGLAGIVRNLSACGYRNPAYIGTARAGRISLINSFLGMNGMSPLSGELVIECSGTARDGYEACSVLLEKGVRPDCVICSTDMRALGVLNCLKDRHLDVPGDLGVYGFDGMRESGSCSPSLTTWAFPWQELGTRAVHELRSRLDGGEIPPYEALKGSLIKRDSTVDSTVTLSDGEDSVPREHFLKVAGNETRRVSGMDRRIVYLPSCDLDFYLSIGDSGIEGSGNSSLAEAAAEKTVSPGNWTSLIESALISVDRHKDCALFTEISFSSGRERVSAACPLLLRGSSEAPVLKARSAEVRWDETVTAEALDYPLPALRISGPESSSLLKKIQKILESWKIMEPDFQRAGLLVAREGRLFRSCLIFYGPAGDGAVDRGAAAGYLFREQPVGNGEDLGAWIEDFYKQRRPGGVLADKKTEEMLPLFGADKDENHE